MFELFALLTTTNYVSCALCERRNNIGTTAIEWHRVIHNYMLGEGVASVVVAVKLIIQAITRFIGICSE